MPRSVPAEGGDNLRVLGDAMARLGLRLRRLAEGQVSEPGGDRYCVQAHWDPKNRRVLRCLTGLFHRELASTRPLQDEQKLLAGRS